MCSNLQSNRFSWKSKTSAQLKNSAILCWLSVVRFLFLGLIPNIAAAALILKKQFNFSAFLFNHL